VLGVTDVWGLFLTHWHNDHTEGAASFIEAYADSLKLVGLPDGFGKRELASYAADRLPDELRAKEIKELVSVLNVLKTVTGPEVVTLSARVRLGPAAAPWDLESLSPSAEDMRHHAATLLSFLPGYVGPPASVWDTNSGCAVLLLQAANKVVMLCSDLDVGEAPDRGWAGIVQHRGAILPSDVVKVGHHGSKTALHRDAWAAFGATAKPRGVVTPFPARGGSLPREPEAAQLRAWCSDAHITARGKGATKAGGVPLNDTPFDSYISTKPKTFEATGQVRYRARAGQPITTKVFPPATRL
jgi:hypothetical protein